MADYHGVRVNSITAELQQSGNRCSFAMTDLTGDDQFARWLSEAMLKVIQSLIETILGHPAGDNVTISFAYPLPDYVEVLEDIYLAPCEFDTPQTAITLPACWQHIPSPLYDEATYRSTIAKCREIISAQSRSLDPVQQVRNLLANYFELADAGGIEPAPPPGLQQLADTLHITPRTLIRRLKQGDTSYKALLEHARKRRAEQLLRQAHLSVADVAHRLGYKEAANFGRAFRKWHGCSPAVWRRGRS
jgi:AraC-like DNA-binding protein